MTFIVAATGSDWIWMLADRRLSYGHGRVKDNARKIFSLETKDGTALLGYAGLGSTAMKNEPSDWMGNTVRGLNLPLEQVLNVLADSAKKRLPRHLQKPSFPGTPSHNIIIPAFVDDHPRIYSIDLSLTNGKKDLNFRYTRHVTGKKSSKGDISPRIAIAGSGAQYICKQKKWAKNILRVIKAHDEEKVTPFEVAKQFAKLNFQVSKKDKYVSKECVVIWRHKKSGGGALNFSGLTKDTKTQFKPIPAIANGMDINAIINVILPHFTKSSEAFFERGEKMVEPDKDAINQELAKLPEGPDDTLA
ncbi:MAG: hypothetical protein HRT93_00040 [Piscirickettsiaceae bacterium]|nr:hypothetical protein [Piscirickettsiaceae bacterium]